MKFESNCGQIWLCFFDEIYLFERNTSQLGSSDCFTRIYKEVISVNLKFLKEKVKGSDRDISTVVLRVFFSRTFSSILLTSNSMVSRAISK